MPIQVPLLNGGNIPLRQTGVSVPRVAQLQAGDTGAGRALQQIGDGLADMAQREIELNDAREMLAFESEMRAAVDAQSIYQQENPNDQDNWLGTWQERTKGLQESLAKRKLTERSRLALSQSFGTFADRHTLQIRTQAFEQLRARTRMDFENKAARLVEDGNYQDLPKLRALAPSSAFAPEELDAMLPKWEEKAKSEAAKRALTQADTLVKEGRVQEAEEMIKNAPMPEHEKANTLASFKAGVAQKKEADDLTVMINDNPHLIGDLIQKKAESGAITGMQRVELENQLERTLAFRRRDAVARMTERMEMLGPPTDEEIEANQDLTDYDRWAMKQRIAGSINLPLEFESALTAAMNFDMAAFPDERQAIAAAANIEAAFESRFKGAHLTTLKEQLAKRMQSLPTAENDIGPALKMLDESIQAGGLDETVGPLMKPEIDPATGKPIMRKPKDTVGFVEVPGWLWGTRRKDVPENEGKPVPLMKPDPVASEKAAAIQREIRRTIEAEVKAGTLKTQADITRRAIDLFTMKGGKLPPVTGGADNQNMLLPPLEAEKTDLNELLKKYGY